MPIRNGHVIGDYLAVDEESGRVHYASEMRRRWDGLLVHESNWETRQPQEFVEARNDPEVLRDVSPRAQVEAPITSVFPYAGQTNTPTPSGPASHLFQAGLGQMVLADSSRTNLILRSQEFDAAAWTLFRATVSGNALAAPDGTLTADALIEDTSASVTHVIRQTLTIDGGARFALSVNAKRRVGSRNLLVQADDGSSNGFRAVFNLGTGAVAVSGAFGAGQFSSSEIQNAGDGFYRCTIVGNIDNTSTNASAWFFLSSGTTIGAETYTGDGSSSLALWGAQLEVGGNASAYIPTGPSAVTRFNSVIVNDSAAFIVS